MVSCGGSGYNYVGALALVLVGWTVAVMIAAGDWDPVRDAKVTSISEASGESASTGRIAVYTDTVQPARTIICTGKQKLPVTDTPEGAKKTKEKEAKTRTVDFTDPDVAIENTSSGQTWSLIAITQPNIDRKNTTVSCAPQDERADSAGYGWALVPDPGRARLGRLIGGVSTAVGIVWAAVTFRRARQSKQPRKAET